ncbi:hypothetical protein SAY87_031954 [Trapa incisa]|uniref:WRKY domain-containing protein n=1 Tax=Trapa incisa TaxID=236973 RepID=A0AAN7QLF1_9MYRT|nr:hypothetical protein SAY87_031954 [Trapa incisa]
MGEFFCGGNWDLEAVVRGGYMSGASDSNSTCDIMEWFDPVNEPMMVRSALPDSQFSSHFPAGAASLEMTVAAGLYNYPAVLPSACSPDTAAGSSGKTMEINNGAGKLYEEASAGSSVVAVKAEMDAVHRAATAKYKRRKNQNKQMVQHLTSDGVLSDLWAWRKYGQKPIKGSPFPRSYYRCSSSKGCLARKQVERSCSEPGMFMVTYTGEHCHSQPTRRSALAGISRPSKLSSSNKKPATAAGSNNREAMQVPKLPSREAITTNRHERCTPTPAAATMEDVVPCKQEILAWGESEMDDKFVNDPSFVLGEEMFMGFDELDDIGSMDFDLYGY